MEPDHLVREYLLLGLRFDRIEEACAPRGGEILKFIGDAALVLWPIGPDGDAAGACNAAIDAACDLTRSLAAEGELRGGLALHRGEVAYGNIGAAERLEAGAIAGTFDIVVGG
jgi:adenylate cyclase